MSPFALNMVLAVVWAALFGGFSIVGLSIGFIVGYLVLWLMQPIFGESRYSKRLFEIIGLILYFHWELFISSVKVAWDVLTPQDHSSPGIVAVPLDVKTPLGITLFANLVSLTPGTLSLDVSDDRSTLLIHGMFVDNPDSLRQEVKSGMERHVREALE